MFIDQVEIDVESGRGGNGAVAFRREKYVPKGGPSGGNGGMGGNVIFVTDNNLSTLIDLRYKRYYKADDGDPGGTGLKDGKNGSHIYIKVPPGTILKERETGEILYDLDQPGMEIVLCRGGKGGKGNSNFATPTQRTPRYAEKGRPGERINLILELKLLADVGLVGFPNAGKSTFISSVSEARPKIADYPFTTLEPNLGIVRYKEFNSFTVADIPGIIEGAHQGKGLGLRFLRHIERTKILLFLIDITSADPKKDYSVLAKELKKFSSELAEKERIICFSKSDLIEPEEAQKLRKTKFRGYKGSVFVISSVTRSGLEELTDILWQTINNKNKRSDNAEI